jgi:sec-independent protein translocase protein TatB
VSFGLTFDKLLIILVIAIFLIGPDRLPGYAAQLARLVKTLRGFADGAKDRMREEMGPEFDEVDWKKLDPRQYDPRRIIREALLDDLAPSPVKPVSPSGPTATPKYRESAYEQRQRKLGRGKPAPFDAEST